MRVNSLTIVLGLAGAMLTLSQLASAQCPGMCIECRQDALQVCGAGCVASVSCSNKDCSCSYSCRAGCRPTGPTGAFLQEDLLRPVRLDQTRGRYSSSPTVHVNSVEQSNVPLAFSATAINNEPGRELSELEFKIKNQTTSTLRQVSVMVVFLDPLNEPLGGETFCEDVVLNPNEERTLRVPLRHYVDHGQRVWLAFRRFKTDAQAWAGNGEEIVKTIKQHDVPPSD